MNLSAKLPGRAETEEWARWRRVMLQKYKVKVVLGKEMTAEDVLKEKPDAVVVATGSSALRDGSQGLTGQPVLGWDSPNVMTADDFLEGKKVPTDKVVIFDGESTEAAPGIAQMLAEQGKQVEIVGRHFMMGTDQDTVNRAKDYMAMAAAGFTFSPITFPISIEPLWSDRQ